MEFRIGKLKMSILESRPGNLVVEYELDGQLVQESIPTDEFLEFAEDLRDSVKEFEDTRKLQEDARRQFDSKTVEKLESMGIRDFRYLTKDTR